MRWDVVRAAFEDELDKIAEVSLQNVKAETAVAASQPLPPMPSAAYETAQLILDKKDAMMGKEAANLQFSSAVTKNRSKKESTTPEPVREAKSLGAHALGGAGIGQLAGGMLHGPRLGDSAKLHSTKWYATAGGAALGAAEYGRKKLRTKKLEKNSSMTPGMSLKASQQVGGFQTKIHDTPSLTAQTPGKIGRKGATP